MASSRSQLGADIHEIDNSASRCGRLLEEVAGDAGVYLRSRSGIAVVGLWGPVTAATAEITCTLIGRSK
jgi:fatty acid synthase, bacteria type